jgi:hypothetical protein
MSLNNLLFHNGVSRPIPVAVRLKVWGYCRSLAGIAGSNPAEAWMLSHVSVVCCRLEVCVLVCSLVQRSPAGCGVSNTCDREDP